MRFGIVLLPQQPWSAARHHWAATETLGFDHAWTYDHLSWRSLANEPWGATIPTLTAAATVTSTIGLGTFVSSPNFRHPVPFAKEIATLDDIAGGRVILGVGSGGTGFDAAVLGQAELSARERHERFREFVEHLDVLLRHEHPLDDADPENDGGSSGHGIDLRGDWFEAHGARMVGAPAQLPRVPFVLAANGPKGLRVVAEHGAGWVTTGPEGVTGEHWWNAVAELAERLDAAASASGREPAAIDRYLSLDSGGHFALDSVASFEDMAARAAGLGFTDVVVHWPRSEGVYSGSTDVLEAAAAALPSLRSLPTLAR